MVDQFFFGGFDNLEPCPQRKYFIMIHAYIYIYHTHTHIYIYQEVDSQTIIMVGCGFRCPTLYEDSMRTMFIQICTNVLNNL